MLVCCGQFWFQLLAGVPKIKKVIMNILIVDGNEKKASDRYAQLQMPTQYEVYNQVLENLSNQKYQILDARSPDRFSGINEEPRPGIKSGHIPKSKNLYYNDLINQDTKKFIEKEEIKNLIKKSDVDTKKDMICSCGSGVTACILKFAIELVSKNKNIKIYDGSWSEWGIVEDSPCEKN